MSETKRVLQIVSELQDIRWESNSGLKDTQEDAKRRLDRKKTLRLEFKKIVGDKIFNEWLDADRI